MRTEAELVVVTGFPRSGTSAWMRVMAAAGLPAVGERFPMEWERTLRDGNPQGFFESSLVGGIHFASNPDARTGARLDPDDPVAVKVFTWGLRRTERRFLDRVLWTVRGWRAVSDSVRRFDETAARGGVEPTFPEGIRPWHLWAREVVATLDDADRRGFAPVRVPYDAFVQDPRRVVTATLRRLDVAGDADRGAAVVRRAEARDEAADPPAAWVDLLDRIDRVLLAEGEPTRAAVRALVRDVADLDPNNVAPR